MEGKWKEEIKERGMERRRSKGKFKGKWVRAKENRKGKWDRRRGRKMEWDRGK